MQHFKFTDCLYLVFLFLSFSCSEYQLEDEMSENEKEEQTNTPASYAFQLLLQSKDNAKINYPLSVFIFDQNNNCIHKETIANEVDDFSSILTKGKYTLVVLSGIDNNECSFPLEITSNGFISLTGQNYLIHPIQMGKAFINLTESTKVTVSLSYIVSALNFSINNIPKDAESVDIKIAPVSSGFTFAGDYKNDTQTCSVSCKKTGDTWTYENLYVLPCYSSQTHLSINIQLPGHNETYGYTYQSALEAGVPYHFIGKYKEGIALDGEFQAEGWKPTVDVEFGFDDIIPDEPEYPDHEEEPENPEEDVFLVKEMPEDDSIWGYFYVWKIQPISTDVYEAIIIAPEQWYTLTSDAFKLLNDYTVDGIDGWRMFTLEEAKAFRDQFQSTIADLNDFIYDYGLSTFQYDEGERYLCNQAQSTFSFSNNRILNAGKTVKYYLRPVKTVRLKQTY